MFHTLGYLILGGLAGVVAGRLMSGHALGWIGDAVLGLIAGLAGGFAFELPFRDLRVAGVGEALAAILVACSAVALLHLIHPAPVRGFTGRAAGPPAS